MEQQQRLWRYQLPLCLSLTRLPAVRESLGLLLVLVCCGGLDKEVPFTVLYQLGIPHDDCVLRPEHMGAYQALDTWSPDK